MNGISKRPVALVALTAAVTLAASGLVWWVADGSKPVPTKGTFRMFLGTVSMNQQANANPAYRCIAPDEGEVTGLPSGQDWCGQVYPSEGLYPAGLTPGVRVRVISFDTGVSSVEGPAAGSTATKLLSALVLPAGAPEPPSGAEVMVRTQADALAFAPHLVGLAEADAITTGTSIGFIVRTISADGVRATVPADFRGTRINLTVVDGIVTKTKVG